MTDPTAEFFGELARRGHVQLLEKISGSVRFDLEDARSTEHWLVTVRKGDIAVSRENAKADAVFSSDKAMFDRIAAGEANAMATTLRGATSVEGDPELLVLFWRLFPGPDRPRPSRERHGSVSVGRSKP